MRTEQLLYGASYEHIIVAPHADDELIGCGEILLHAENVTVLLQEGMPNDARMKETEAVLQCILLNAQLGLKRVVERLSIQNYVKSVCARRKPTTQVIWFPDPHYETHPEHKLFTDDLKQKILHNMAGCPVIFGLYSVRMNTPYLHKLDKGTCASKMILADHYVSQSEYFKQHNDSFFFEGRILL
jgi:hypothetical protein